MLQRSKVKYIQNLGHKKFREEEGLFIAEGPRLIHELLIEKKNFIKEIFAVKEWMDENALVTADLELNEITEGELERISQLRTPNKVLALVRIPGEEMPANLHGKIVLALDAVQDPGNLGTIIRIADWFGLSDIICNHQTADCFNPKVVQATMGSLARVKVHYADLPAWLASQKKMPLYACTMEGKNVSTMGKIKEGIIVIGNEAKGIDTWIEGLSHEKITIVGKGGADSLNAAVATGIILFQLT